METKLDKPLLCPVCRAKQSLQTTCRRCAADLTLYCRVLESEQTARRQRDEARDRNDVEAATSLASYLRWIRPAKSD